MNNFVVKASESYKSYYKFAYKFCEFPPCAVRKPNYCSIANVHRMRETDQINCMIFTSDQLVIRKIETLFLGKNRKTGNLWNHPKNGLRVAKNRPQVKKNCSAC